MSNTVLFVTHRRSKCGVYEFGEDVYECLKKSSKFNFIKCEASSLGDIVSEVKKNEPFLILYNFHPSSMPWLIKKRFRYFYSSQINKFKAINVVISHIVDQKVIDRAVGYRNKYFISNFESYFTKIFDYYIAPNPTLLLKNPLVFKVGKLIRPYQNIFNIPKTVTIGSFGFGTKNKGFDKIIKYVQSEFDEAIIKLNIPFADYGDSDGANAKKIELECRSLIKKPGIKLEVTHEYWSKKEMLDFLAKNSINVFFYEDINRKDISGAVDNAIAAGRPIAITKNSMFKHLFNVKPSICIEDRSLKEMIQTGFGDLRMLQLEWSPEVMLWEFERIINEIISLKDKKPADKFGIKRTLINAVKRFFSLPSFSFVWINNTDSLVEDKMSVLDVNYNSIKLIEGGAGQFNRILDDAARDLYRPTIDLMYNYLPRTMAKKIPRAVVQQAFVFDTVYRTAIKYPRPKILCIGSFEDTASLLLQRFGFTVEEIDPIINYCLQDFVNKPTIKLDYYDIIFSTSVIEHDSDDESFMKCIDKLLAPGGMAVITCDYKDGWKPGEPKPDVDARLYTKADLSERLLSYVPGCKLVDKAEWDCPEPDFFYLNKYRYTFATFTIRKVK